tara:strand:- start:336 stop:800 length:465 start_codon:yes stop_codon:yes gene_type:complete
MSSLRRSIEETIMEQEFQDDIENVRQNAISFCSQVFESPPPKNYPGKSKFSESQLFQKERFFEKCDNICDKWRDPKKREGEAFKEFFQAVEDLVVSVCNTDVARISILGAMEDESGQVLPKPNSVDDAVVEYRGADKFAAEDSADPNIKQYNSD